MDNATATLSWAPFDNLDNDQSAPFDKLDNDKSAPFDKLDNDKSAPFDKLDNDKSAPFDKLDNDLSAPGAHAVLSVKKLQRQSFGRHAGVGGGGTGD